MTFHLHLEHNATCLQKYKCGENAGPAKFDILRCFKRHLKSTHNFLNDFVSSPNQPTSGLESECEVDADSHDSAPKISNEPQTCNISLEDFKASLQVQAEAFVSKLYSKPNLPRNHVQHIIDDTDVFLGGGYLNILKENCLQSLPSCNADVQVVTDLQKMFDVLQEPFKELKTEYQRLKCFKASSDYIPPESYSLGRELVLSRKRAHDGERRAEWVDVEAQSFPLRHALKKFLELPNSLNDILSYVQSLKSETDTISNFVQSELWKSKIQNFNNDIVLPLFIFFDDFECNNALGPNSGKLGAVYASIPCLPPECRAALENIFLTLLFNSKDREEFSNKKVLQPLIDELKFLEETGIMVQTSEGEKKIYFSLGLVIGDNLGVHQICGFVESFKANYPCRFCKATKEQVQVMEKIDETLLRNVYNYNEDVSKKNVTVTGINSECEFNKIPSFHVTSNYAVDVMHDLAEGVIPYAMGLIVSDLIAKKFFTLHDLNNRIRMFNFGPEVTNKPPVITEENLKKKKVKMSASQSFCFVRHFGALVGDLIPNDNMSWNLYLTLMRVLDVALAKTVPKSTCITFPVLVQELIHEYKRQGNVLKPKFHFLLHYAMVFKMCGPVSHLSCIRFEGKHRQLKQTAISNMSRVNLSYSVGIKHQLNLCNRFKANKSILPALEIGSIQEMYLADHKKYFDFLPSLPASLRNTEVMTLSPKKWIDFKGTHYSKSQVLVTGRDAALWWPTFGKIQFILLDKNTPIFVCSSLRNIGFSDHFHGYEVQESPKWFCISSLHLVDPLPVYYLATATGEKFVVLKYLI